MQLSQLPQIEIDDEISEIRFVFKQDQKTFGISLYDKYLEFNNKYYYVKEGIDWNFINSFLIKYPSLSIGLLQNGIDLGFKAFPILQKIESNNEIIYELDTYEYFYDRVNYYPSHIILEFDNQIIYN